MPDQCQRARPPAQNSLAGTASRAFQDRNVTFTLFAPEPQFGPCAIPGQSDWSPSAQVGQDSHGPAGRNHHAVTAGDREAASAQVSRSLLK